MYHGLSLCETPHFVLYIHRPAILYCYVDITKLLNLLADMPEHIFSKLKNMIETISTNIVIEELMIWGSCHQKNTQWHVLAM